MVWQFFFPEKLAVEVDVEGVNGRFGGIWSIFPESSILVNVYMKINTLIITLSAVHPGLVNEKKL